jgi:hypothetical protein
VKRPRVIDAFMMHDELDILEMRLTELDKAVDWFVIVEADVTHQDVKKPSYYLDNKERFAPWADRIVHIWATGLPTVEQDSDPWAREHAQREHIRRAFDVIDADPDDVVMQSDIDEIPTAVAARNVRPQGFVSFEQRGHFFAIDWLYPHPWFGTVAGRAGKIPSFGAMRDVRNVCPQKLPNAGWHFSWLGGAGAARKKLNSFCHPEVRDRIDEGLQTGNKFLENGIHVDGSVMQPCEVDGTYPKWIRDGNAPQSWYRPR